MNHHYHTDKFEIKAAREKETHGLDLTMTDLYQSQRAILENQKYLMVNSKLREILPPHKFYEFVRMSNWYELDFLWKVSRYTSKSIEQLKELEK